MPNRILKETICTSENIAMLTRDGEVFFYRLMVQCDDYGRMDARPAILRAKCYPLQLDVVTDANIGTWLAQLETAGLICQYAVNSKPYLQVVTWDKHQQVRAKRSKYPAMQASDSRCDQPLANDDICPRNPIQSESNPNPTPIQSGGVVVLDPDWAEALREFENNIGVVTGSIAPEMQDTWDTLKSGNLTDWWAMAVKVAVTNNKRSWGYVQGVLNKCLQRGAPPLANGNGSKRQADNKSDTPALAVFIVGAERIYYRTIDGKQVEDHREPLEGA